MAETGKSQLRDAQGHFIKSKAKVSGAGNLLANLIHAREGHDNEALIDIKITNPLKRIVEVLQEIKKHQATTFSFKFTVPLIALPVFLLAAFQFGRVQTACPQLVTSKLGTIKNLSVEVARDDSGWFWWLFSPQFTPKPQAVGELEAKNLTILIGPQGETITVLHDKGLNLETYENQRVILTGKYSSCGGAITLDSPKNLTLLP